MKQENEKQPTCEDRIDGELESTVETLQRLWDLWKEDSEAYDDELGRWDEYGLSFDYVPMGTFSDQEHSFFRYQLSWGGPGDEFRFFLDWDGRINTVEYWFLDWGEGASRKLSGETLELLVEIWDNEFQWQAEELRRLGEV